MSGGHTYAYIFSSQGRAVYGDVVLINTLLGCIFPQVSPI